MTTRTPHLKTQAPSLKPAFTIVELLVVVAIIVILVSILTPSLERALAHAQNASCMANVDSIGTSVEYYLMDFRRTYPDGNNPAGAEQWGPHAGSKPPQQLLVEHSIHAAKVFICPTDPNPKGYDFWEFHVYPAFIEQPPGDTVNNLINGPPGAVPKGCSYMFSEEAAYELKARKGTTIRAAQVVNPSQWAYMADGFKITNGRNWSTLDVYFEEGGGVPGGTKTPGWDYRTGWTHFNSFNMLLGDKSVASVEQLRPNNDKTWLRKRYRSNPLGKQRNGRDEPVDGSSGENF